MKFTPARTALALALVALGLSACGGGGKAQFQIKGTISGLKYDGMVLSTNGMSVSPKAADTTFSFPNTISYGDTFNILISTAPAHQTCAVYYGNDTAGHTAAINAQVVCSDVTHFLSGSITGLTASGLVLVNGSNTATVSPASGATTFTMPTGIAYGVTYGVTVLTQPTGQTCSVTNGVGTMGDADITNLAITCVNN